MFYSRVFTVHKSESFPTKLLKVIKMIFYKDKKAASYFLKQFSFLESKY